MSVLDKLCDFLFTRVRPSKESLTALSRAFRSLKKITALRDYASVFVQCVESEDPHAAMA